MKRIIVMTFTALLLNACATLPPQAPPSTQSWQKRKQSLSRITHWKINGKIAVRSQQESGSATLDWTQKNQTYRITLFGPLGTNNMKLSGKPGLVELIAPDGKHFKAKSADALLAQEWGFRLPVSSLYYWVRSLPAPGQSFKRTFDRYHRVRSLTQGQWKIDYTRYTRRGKTDLPTMMRIKSPELSAKLVIYEWQI